MIIVKGEGWEIDRNGDLIIDGCLYSVFHGIKAFEISGMGIKIKVSANTTYGEVINRIRSLRLTQREL